MKVKSIDIAIDIPDFPVRSRNFFELGFYNDPCARCIGKETWRVELN